MRPVLVAFLVITLFWGCKKEPILDQKIDPVSKFVTVSASADNGVVMDPSGVKVVEVGTTMTYTITSKLGYNLKSVSVNNVEQSADKIQKQSAGNYLFNLEKIQTDKVVDVQSGPSDNFLLVVKDFYYLDRIDIIQDGKVVDKMAYSEESKSDKTYFYSNGKCMSYHKDGTLFGQCDWYFKDDENHMMVGSQYCTISILTSTELVYSVDGLYNNKPCKYESHFWRI